MSLVALSPDLMLVVSMTSVLPSHQPTLLPIHASTPAGQRYARAASRLATSGTTRLPSISR
jgi:hypothetical protein